MMVSEIGLGTWTYHGGADLLRKGFSAGALFVDTAESYGSEPIVGEALKGIRNSVFVATKISPEHFHKADMIKAADASLLRLQTDHIDLYQLHNPSYTVPIEETLGAVEDLVDDGKVRFVGVSNFNVAELKRAQGAMKKHRIVSNQVRYNLVDRTIGDGLLEYCAQNDIAVIAYSPLSRGLPFILDGDPHGVLARVSKEAGKTMAQVAINWCLRHSHVFAIPKGNSAGHVAENCGASGWLLDAGHIRMLNEHILFRKRSKMETLLRRLAPATLKNMARSLVQKLPVRVKRNFN